MSRSFTLYRLQQLDSQLDHIRQRQGEIQIALNDAQALRQAEAEAHQADAALQTARKNLHKAEETVKEQRLKIETTEAALYGGKVRNPKELQDLQHESAALKRFLSVLEDRQLEAMLSEEEVAAASRAATIQLELAQANHNQRLADLKDEHNRLLKDTSRLEEERQATVNSIPPDDKALYETLRKQRRGIAVSIVKNKACNTCGVTLNAILLDAALTSGQLTRCDGCGRILYLG